MKFACESCHAQYMISDEKVGPRGVKVRCKKCNHVNVVRRQAPATDPDLVAAAPAPQRPAGNLDDELGAAFAHATSGSPGPEQAIAPTRLEGPGFDDSSFPANEFDNAIGDLERTRIIDNPEMQRLFEEREREDQPAAPVLAPAAATAHAHEWYVAIDDQQLGPIPFDDVRSRWEGGSIGPDTLCWRTGMADWSPLSQVHELADALAPRPAAPAAGTTGSDSSWLDAAMTPRETPAPSWKPSAASALADLVEAELEASRKADAPIEATLERDLPASDESTGIRSLLRELPKSEAPEQELSRLLPLSPAPAPAAQPAPAPQAAAAVPAQEKRGGAGKWIAIAAGIVVLAGGGVFASGLLGGPSQPPPPAAPAPVAAAPAPVAPEPVAAAPAAVPEPEPAPVPEEGAAELKAGEVSPAGKDAPTVASAEVDRAQEAADKVAAEAEAEAKALAAARAETPRPAPAKATRPARARTEPRREAPAPRPAPAPASDLLDAAGSTSSIDSLFANEFKPASKAPAPKTGGSYIPPAPGGGGSKPHQLSQGDIAGVVVGHKGALKTCATSYKAKQGGGSGTVVMRWTIRPNGTTTDIRPVKGTEHKELATCIGVLVKGWKFPAYGGPQMAPIDFPFQF